MEPEPPDEAPDPDVGKASFDGKAGYQQLVEAAATASSLAGRRVSQQPVAVVKDLVAHSPVNLALANMAQNLVRLPTSKVDLSPLYNAAGVQTSKVLLEFLKVSDLTTPTFARSLGLSVGADLSKALTAGSALTSWRVALASEYRIEHLVQGMALSLSTLPPGLVEDLRLTSGLITRMSEMLAVANPSHQAFVMPALVAYRAYAGEVAVDSGRQFTMLRYAGRGVSGLSATELLLGGAERGRSGPVVAEVRQELVAPWVSGPDGVRGALLVRLQELDPSVPDLLRRAWLDVQDGGPAELVTIAACAVEAIDRSLRSAAAPEAAVEAWADKSPRPRNVLFDTKSGRVTRAARIGFILRERPGEPELLDAQERAIVAGLAEVRGRLEAAKHASEGDIVGVQGLLMAAEAMLIQLFLS